MENSGWRLTNVRLALFFATQGSMVFVSGLLIECADSGYSLLWPAAGVGFAALATVQRDSWRRLLAGHVIAVALASLLLGRHPAATSVGFGVVGALELFVAVSVYLRLTRGSPTLQGAAELVKLVIASALGVSLVALFGGLLLRGDNRFESAAVAAQFFSHLSGIVMLAPIFLVERRRVVPPGRWPEIVLQGATLAVVLALVSQGGSRPLGFLPFAALAWAAARMRPRLTAIELFVSAVVINVTTLRGWGPFAEYGRELGNAHLGSQLSVVYQLTLLVTILPLALTVNRDRHTAVSLSASEDMYRRTFDDAMLGMVMLERSSATHGGSFIARVNPVASQFLAANASEVLGTGLLDHLFATDQEPVGAALSEVFAGTLDTWSGHVQLAGQTYDELHVSMTLSPLRGEHGQVDRVAVQMADVTNAHHAAERLADLALHDPLTGLANRTLLEDRLQHWLGIGTRECTQVLVLYIDLDDFKIVNDSAGHETGDQLLLEVSRRLVEALRPHDTVARLGGDEFVVIAPKMAGDSAPASNVVSTRLLTALSAPYHIHGETYSVGASIGMTLSRNGSTPTSLMREADSAMYEAKRKGKNCRHLFVESTDTVLTDRARMVGQLNEAFTKDQFELHIQPLIDLASGTVVGGERRSSAGGTPNSGCSRPRPGSASPKTVTWSTGWAPGSSWRPAGRRPDGNAGWASPHPSCTPTSPQSSWDTAPFSTTSEAPSPEPVCPPKSWCWNSPRHSWNGPTSPFRPISTDYGLPGSRSRQTISAPVTPPSPGSRTCRSTSSRSIAPSWLG
ncbi:MAG: diguanylate cyclase [Brevibacterium aurantiacum]|nr:diguanylate cyclase [Brevibacterium aurantiacum]